MDKIRAPYNFVPVSDTIRFVDDEGAISHDRPFREGITATLDYRVEAETPLFVRGKEDKFFRTPDDKLAIPGTAVRGMLRNVVEIATFGKLGRINDHTYGVRDLHNRDLYISQMAEIAEGPDGKKIPMPTVSAGWLRLLDEADVAARSGSAREGDTDVVAEIEVCDFYKIEYRRLIELAEKAGVRGFDPGRKQSSQDKYRAWGDRPLAVEVPVQRLRFGEASTDALVPFLGDMGRVVSQGVGVQGTLVFTGQPQQWRADLPPPRPGAGHPKHHDFVFVRRSHAERLPVTRAQLQVFSFVHADHGQQGRLTPAANPEWKYWKDRLERDASAVAPVFVLPYSGRTKRTGQLRAFGLAMMFRLAYDYSTGHHADNAQRERLSGRLDMAEAIFGTVPLAALKTKEDRASLKGRVSVGLALADRTAKPLQQVRAVLGSPKASYYPNYVEQANDSAGAPPAGGRYLTYMDENGCIRGWKRYRPHATANANPILPAKASEKVITKFAPLGPTSFIGRMRIHNLRPEELGALVWASRFGGDPSARHTLGMARSLGYGRVTMKVSTPAGEALRTNSGETLSLEECEARFVKAMETWASEVKLGEPWSSSLQIGQLIACAVPFPAGSDDARHMMLDHPTNRNEFTQAKKDRLALAPAKAVKREVRRSGAVARSAAGVAAVAVAVAAIEHAGTIKWFRNGEVALRLDAGGEHKIKLNVDIFTGFGQLNGNTLKVGRKVVVTLRGERVERVTPA